MKTVDTFDGDLNQLLDSYRYQPQLTQRLDGFGDDFTQEIINEIVLWKVNRYAQLREETLQQINTSSDLLPGSHRNADLCLRALLGEGGVDLPMASTILRFRNPRTFQIVDRRAYRAVSGEDYPLYATSSIDQKVELYFNYLDRLVDLANDRGVEFCALDRALYIFDKQFNGKL